MGMSRFDERDTIFSRVLLQDGTPEYDEYYSRRPERKVTDDRMREHVDGIYSDHLPEQAQVEGTFAFLKDIRPFARGAVRPEKADLPPREFSERIKKTARSFGAVLCGITRSDPSFYYSVRGRGERYGETVPADLPFVIVLAVEMDRDEILTAPAAAEAVEVTRGYARAALAAMIVSYTIREMGYRAVCHMDGESELVMPPAAKAAGLGDLGRQGVLVTKEFGPRVRLAAVTTDLPLVPDPPSRFSLEKVCLSCGKCEAACPAGAVPPERGMKVNHEACFLQWKAFGTDCGLCLAVCPFSK